jgi:hypothetical protein
MARVPEENREKASTSIVGVQAETAGHLPICQTRWVTISDNSAAELLEIKLISIGSKGPQVSETPRNSSRFMEFERSLPC